MKQSKNFQNLTEFWAHRAACVRARARSTLFRARARIQIARPNQYRPQKAPPPWSNARTAALNRLDRRAVGPALPRGPSAPAQLAGARPARTAQYTRPGRAHYLPGPQNFFAKNVNLGLDNTVTVCYNIGKQGRRPTPKGGNAHERRRNHSVTYACDCGYLSGNPDKEITAPHP